MPTHQVGKVVLDYVIYHSTVDRLAALETFCYDTILCKWYWVIKVHIVINCPMCFFDFNLPNAWHWRKWETTYYLCRHSWQNVLNVQWLYWLIAWLWFSGTFSTNRLYRANCASLLCLQLLSIILQSCNFVLHFDFWTPAISCPAFSVPLKLPLMTAGTCWKQLT